MEWETDVIELIKKRRSVRTYTHSEIEPCKLKKFEAFLAPAKENPFGADVRLEMMELPEGSKIGTYGAIRGAKHFFGGCVKKGGLDIEGFGYVFEKAVLYATSLGLGTCWLGGFQRKKAEKLLSSGDEIIPAISPLGYEAQNRSLVEKIVTAGAGSASRKAFEEIFFYGSFSKPLVLKDSPLRESLEMVRLGPSASNKQPWRLLMHDGKCHFYLMQSKRYAGNLLFGFCLQRLDMGIAACHFELCAKQTGLPGAIVFEDPNLLTKEEIENGLSYSFSWA